MAAAASGSGIAADLGVNLAAAWLAKLGGDYLPDKLQSLLAGPLALPKHNDMVRVADLALSQALTALREEMKGDATAAGGAGDDFLNGLNRLIQQAIAHTTRLNPADAGDAIATALAHLSNQSPAQALNQLLIDAIAPDLRATGDADYQAKWQSLTDRLYRRLPDLLAAYVTEALKTDERFFRAVTLTQQSTMVAMGQDVLTAMQQQEAALGDLREQLNSRLDNLPSPPGVEAFKAALTQGLAALQSAIQAELDNDRAPPLIWHEPTQQTGQELSLLYYDRKASFVGRDVALAALNRFIDDSAPLLWTSVTGGAGVGKSRLVLEALSLRRLTGGVQATFLPPSAGWLTAKDYEKWRAPVPTVLVIDYAGASPELIRDLIDNLACRADAQALRAPVRLLLLDTQPNQGEFALPNRIKDSTEKGRRAARVEWSDAARTDLDLHPLSNADLLTITALYRGDAPLAEAEVGKVTAAVKADPELGRPLFAALMGLALRHGTDTPLTLAGVTNHFLDRQETHWVERDQITPLDRTLLALATLGGSVPLKVLDEPELAANAAALDNACEHWACMTGKPWNDAEPRPFTKLEPDFVGGLFILRYIQRTPKGRPRSDAQQKQELTRLITLAWKHGDPGEPLINLARNFAGAAEWVEIVTKLTLYRPPGKQGVSWALLVPALAFAMAQRGADDPVDRLLDALAAGDSPLDKIMLARACFASGLTAELGIHPRADERLDRLRHLASDNPTLAPIALELVKGLVNALHDAGTDTARVDQLLQQLRDIANIHNGNADIALELAKGLVNALYDTGTDTARVDDLLRQLRDIANIHNGNAGIALELANGLVNALRSADTDTARVDELLRQLRDIANIHNGNADIALQLAKGLVNAIGHAGTDTARVDNLLRQLRDIANVHNGNAYIALELAKGLFNALNRAGTDTARIDELLRQLRDIANIDNANADIALPLARGLFNALCSAGTDTARVDELLQQLRDIANIHNSNADIALRLAQGLFNALNRAGTDTARVDELLRQLRDIANIHNGNADIALRLAKGLVNALYDAGTDTARVDELLRQLRDIANIHNGNADIALQLANGLFNAIGHAGRDAARVDDLLRQLCDIANIHNANADIALRLAQGLAITIHRGHGDDDALLDQLSALAAAHPGVAFIEQAPNVARQIIAERRAGQGGGLTHPPFPFTDHILH